MDTTTQIRPDSDIEADIREFIRTYAPLQQAKLHFDFVSEGGVVTITGHVRSVQARRVLVDNVPDFEGVTQVVADTLYDDETLRLEVGSVLPRGVMVRVNYGHVTLHGTLPEGEDADVIEAKALAVPGVRKTDTQF